MSLHPGQEHNIYEIAGTTTIRCPEESNGKLNHTVGFGMTGPVTRSDLSTIRHEPAPGDLEFYICEHAHPSAVEVLRSEGYEELRSISHFVRDLDDSADRGDVAINEAIDVDTLSQSELQTFIDMSVAGFRDAGRAPSLLQLLAESAAHRDDTTLFFARINDENAGSAGLAVLEVGDVKIGNLYIDSTLPAFRGKGVHQALLKARLGAAKRAGCRYVISTARKGSGSARNIEKAGLERVFDARIYAKKAI